MRRASPWLAAALGLAITLAAFWPGYLSWDSAYQWWQARGGELDPTHPPVMVRTWQLSRAVLPDPGGMLLLPAAVWWSALALLANALGGSAARRAATVLVTGLWPPLLALLPHLWKDVWLIALLALAVAALAQDLRLPSRRWRMLALFALGLGCAFRFNALPAALPLLAWIAWRELPGRRAAAAGLTLALVTALQLFAGIVNHVPGGREVPVWPSLAMWDIAAVSIAEERLLFPPDWVDPALTVADLRRDFSPHVNVPSFARGQLYLNFYFDYTPEQFAALRAAWLSLPREHAPAYFAHRARLSAYLFGLRQSDHPDGSVLQPTIVAFQDNPPVARNQGWLNRRIQPVLDGLVDAPIFAPWVYLLVATGLLARFAWPRAPLQRGQVYLPTEVNPSPFHWRALAATVAASSLLLALPLVLVAPSADFRYLGWCVMATLLAMWLSWPPEPRNGRHAIA